MYFTVQLPHACVCDVMRGLRQLVAKAQEYQKRNPWRPQPMAMRICEAQANMLPAYIENTNRRYFVVYERLPGPGCQTGERLLVAAIPRVPDCGGNCASCRRRAMELEVRYHMQFPFDRLETEAGIAACFGGNPQSITHTHPAWLTSEGSSEHGRSPGGAPLSPSTQWLQDEIAKLADRTANRHLFAPWLERITADTGRKPVDPKNQFRHTARDCIRRIEEQERRAYDGEAFEAAISRLDGLPCLDVCGDLPEDDGELDGDQPGSAESGGG